MTDRKNLREIRRLLIRFMDEIGSKRQLDSSTITEEFIRKHADSIDHSIDSLKRIAIKKLIGSIESRRLRFLDKTSGLDLFGGYSLPAAIVLPSPAHTRNAEREHRPFEKLTLAEADFWLASKQTPKLRNTSKIDEVRRFIEVVRPYMNAEMTLLDGVRAAREAEGK